LQIENQRRWRQSGGDNANVITSDIMASKGIVRVSDTVVIP